MNPPVIICIDDEQTILDSLKIELESALGHSYLLEMALSGEEALEVMSELKQDGYEVAIAIADYIMPDMKGDKLLQHIHGISPRTMKIMLTGQADLQGVTHAINNAKLYRYIAKPWQAQDLNLTIKQALYSYEQDKKLAQQNTQLQEMNQALAESNGEQAALITQLHEAEQLLAQYNRTLERQVAERTQELNKTLEHLKTTQQELIQFEKMAALGQLVAGVAHEINTPLGAIKASSSNTLNAVRESLNQLPQLYEKLDLQQQKDFFALMERSLQNNPATTSRERRSFKRALTRQLQVLDIDNPRVMADTLMDMGIWQDIEPFLPLLKADCADLILQLGYNLARLDRNSKNIIAAVERAAKVVFALKNYARQDSSGEKQLVQISEGLETVLQLYYNQLKKGVEVIRDYQPLHLIWCYPDELIQVWTNLIYNAVQAMEGKGRLEIGVGQQDNCAVVQITDSGCGIPVEIQERIFEPFFTTKPPGEGSGLGLDIVRKILEKHEGKIEVNSVPGKTTFTVSIPIGTNQSEDLK